MTEQPLPPADLDPLLPADFTPQMGIRMWCEVMAACDELLRAGLRREIGPDGDLEAAYRKWHEQQYAEHERALLRMADHLNKLAEHAPPRSS